MTLKPGEARFVPVGARVLLVKMKPDGFHEVGGKKKQKFLQTEEPCVSDAEAIVAARQQHVDGVRLQFVAFGKKAPNGTVPEGAPDGRVRWCGCGKARAVIYKSWDRYYLQRYELGELEPAASSS